MFSFDTYLFLFLAGVVGTLVLTPLVRRFVLRRGIAEDPDIRKIHECSVPTLGGLAVFATFTGLVVSCLLFENKVTSAFLEKTEHVFGIVACGSIALLLGVYDDIRGADAKKKFSVQIAAAILAFALGFRIKGVSLGPFGAINVSAISLPVTIFWIVGVTNAINIIDGLDGLAAGVTFFVCIGSFFVSLVLGNVVMSVFSVILAGALLGFLRYNFPPARIFLGNTGSLFLGMVLALVSIISAQKGSTIVLMLIPIAALGLPLLDTTLAIFRRSLLGRPVFVSDKGHIHHALLRLGLSHRKTVLVLYAFCMFLLGFAALVVHQKSTEATVYLIVIGLISLVGMRVLGYLDYHKIRKALCSRWRYRVKHVFCRLTLLKIRNAVTVDQVWDLLTGATTEFEVDRIELSVNGQKGDSMRRWENAKDRPMGAEVHSDGWRSQRFDLPGDMGYLSFTYHRSHDEDYDVERHYRLDLIGQAADKKLTELMNGERVHT